MKDKSFWLSIVLALILAVNVYQTLIVRDKLDRILEAIQARPAAPSPQPGTGPRLDPNRRYEFSPQSLKGSPSLGPANAKVTLVEFFDYNCPFCQRGGATVEELLKRHPDWRVVAKHFPLPMHPNAMKTSEATLCADGQGKFWEYRKEVFGDFWGKSSAEDLKQIAKKIGLDEKVFAVCLDGGRAKARVENDKALATALGVQSTPTFFVNGRPVIGAQPAENFEKAAAASAEAQPEKKTPPAKPQVYA